MTQKQNAAMEQAIDLLINNDTDVSILFRVRWFIKRNNQASCRESSNSLEMK
ncbi:hypothetical protein [Rickettsia felis]|uniref:hypothetical protein n=1 Tax=Rickettsia felis TaxID=42862 RepID=UPI000AC6DD00|nr:hypothetical protein [Rickettsia felis]